MNPIIGASPLATVGLERFGSDSNGLLITDKGVPSLIMLRANAAQSDAVQGVLGLALPGVLQSTHSEERTARWMSPDMFLVSVESDQHEALISALSDALGSHAAAVDVSGGYAVLELSGPALMEVLRKSTAYDVHPDNFPVGKVVNTTFAKASVTLRACDKDVCELVVRRSFAHYVFQWLEHAAREHGIGVVTAGEQQ